MPMYAGVAALFRVRTIRFGAPRLSAAAHRPRPSRQPLLLPPRCRHLSSSGASKASDDGAKPTDTFPAPGTIVDAEVIHTNAVRNQEIRQSFWDKTPEIDQEVREVLDTAYIPPARQYPTKEATELSLARARRMARIRVAHEIQARKGVNARSRYARDTFNLLRRMTQPRGQKPVMHAMRIVLPKTWSFDIEASKSVNFVEARTGVAARLRMTGDLENDGAIVLRGRGSVLTKAGDELIAACKDVQIFKLGEVTSFDYASQRLWPVIDGAEDGGSIVPSDQLDNIWIHREQPEYWIDSAYEKTPRPTEWSKESFDTYITSLVYGRLKPGLTMSVYRRRFVDTDGIRVRMIMDAFEDLDTRMHITTPVLKMALQFMCTRGGHRAAAERLLAQAEKWGVPVDTDAFNILLDSYVLNHDVRYFHKLLVKMRERCFYPNVRTWLLFVNLVQRDDVRRQIEATMFDLGFFQDPGTRRSVSITMARQLAYQAFRAGETMAVFLNKQIGRFGSEWLTVESANSVLDEFFLFHQSSASNKRYSDYQVLFDRLAAEGKKLDVSTLNIVLEHCARPYVQDWGTALWALDKMRTSGPGLAERRAALVPDKHTYRHLLSLCLATNSTAALGATVFYTVKARQLDNTTRKSVTRAMLGRVEGDSWRSGPVRLMSGEMAQMLREGPVNSKGHAVGGLEFAVLESTKGFMPAEPLADVLRAALQMDRQSASASQTGGGASAEVSQCVAIKLADVKGERPPMEVRLDSAFDARTMVRYNQNRWQTPPRTGESAGQKSEDKTTPAARRRQPPTKKAASTEDKPGAAAQEAGATTVAEQPAKSSEQSSAKSGDHPLVHYVNSLHQ